jgi:predicted Fe-Mo cluster-binding NifX family protein
MRVAISIEDNQGINSTISHHFGRCPYFALVDLEGEVIQEVAIIDNPYYAKHEPGMVPSFIKSQSVEAMISGGMGRRAIAFFQQFDIQAVTGATGTVQTTLEAFFRGELSEAAPCRESVDHAHGERQDH